MSDDPAPPTSAEDAPPASAEPSADPEAPVVVPAPEVVAAPPAPVPPPPVVEIPRLPAPPSRPRPSLAFLGIVSIVSLALDLGSKWWAKAHLDDPHVFPYKKVELIKDHVALVFAKNKGGAWGLLQDENENLRRPFFLLISAAAVIFIVSLYRKLSPQQTALKWGLPLVLGGALGNLVDRIRYGHVVDFVDVYMKDSHWPTFNIADVAICVGVGLMAVDMFTSRKLASTPPAVVDAPPPAPPPGAAPTPVEPRPHDG